ncbi:MAG: polyphosphate:AMP phosphotransferase [Spirulinaceae cyanobacterium]
MLDNLDLTLSLDQDSYKSQINDLMRQLRMLQMACWEKKLPVIVVLEGWTAAGKGSLVKKIVNYMDARGFEVHPILPPTPQEQQYPFLWRFWGKIPPQGKIGFFYHSWYSHVWEDRLLGKLPEARAAEVFAQINAFEKNLAADGVAIAKFCLHLSHKELKKRLKKYAANELNSWRVRPEDWQQAKRYQEYFDLAEEMLLKTNTKFAPWNPIASDCNRWAKVKVLSQLVTILKKALEEKSSLFPGMSSTPTLILKGKTKYNRLEQVDLSKKLTKESYQEQLRKAQIELRSLQRSIHQAKIPVLVLFEGWDASGKGGAIKRLSAILDPRNYQVSTFAAPTDEEKQYHYLWRFWRRLPPAGTIGIFDRSWYGRVLVERVEGLANVAQWSRAYEEINQFEQQLTSRGYVLVKFWLHLSSQEQLKRFEQRRQDPLKQYKLTEEDWRNREKWHLYEGAINQAIEATDTPHAPWTVVPADDKYYARVETISTVIKAIQGKL